jgi:hypothetical protein
MKALEKWTNRVQNKIIRSSYIILHQIRKIYESIIY